jgi:hypothetical protein
MTFQKHKVIKVVLHSRTFILERTDFIVYDNFEMLNVPILYSTYSWFTSEIKNLLAEGKDLTNEQVIEFINKYYEDGIEIDVSITVKLGEKTFERKDIIKLGKKKREIVDVDIQKEKEHFNYKIKLNPDEYRWYVAELIMKIEKDFYLSEKELLGFAKDCLFNGMEIKQFSTQVEISGCIADGLAFVVNESTDFKLDNMKIIAFEVKTNADNYNRLLRQIEAYMHLADEVYLVIQDKEIPADLPFFVGVIQILNGEMKIFRYATTLIHSMDQSNFWRTIIRLTNKHIGLEKGQSINIFFGVVESIKRKMIWNQFVVGFHSNYVKEYLEFTEEEKSLIKAYFGKDAGGKMLNTLVNGGLNGIPR